MVENNNDNFVIFTQGNASQRLDVIGELGEGNFGKVLHVKDKRRKSFVVRKLRCNNNSMFNVIAPQMKNLLKTKCDNIVKFYGFDFKNDPNVLLVMDYCEKGNLNDRLHHEIEADVRYKWIIQLINALIYLHDELHVIHRNLKPSNVLLDENDVIKVSDYGLARRLSCLRTGNSNYLKDKTSYLSEYRECSLNHFPANEFWFPPEVFKIQAYTDRSDVYALGLLMYAIESRQFVVVDGKQYFGCFVHFRGEEKGLGTAMFHSREQISASYEGFPETRTSTELRNLLQKILLSNSICRLELNEIKLAFNKIYNDFIQLPGENQQNQQQRWYHSCTIQ